MIYDYIVKGTGTITIFSEYEFSRQVDKTTVHLLHVNRLIRYEVQEFFYKSQTFDFRSAQAVNKFLKKIGPWHASLIRNVQLGPWLCGRKIENFVGEIMPVFQSGLTGVDRLSISSPPITIISLGARRKARYQRTEVPSTFLLLHYEVKDMVHHTKLQPGLKTYAILCASQQLASGKIYLKQQSIDPENELLFVPRDVEYPAEVIEDNPLWARYEATKKYSPYAMYLGSNPYTKTHTIHFRNVAMPDMSVMQAVLASALPPSKADKSISDEPKVYIDGGDVENVGNRDHRDCEKESGLGERVIPDSDEVNNNASINADPELQSSSNHKNSRTTS